MLGYAAHNGGERTILAKAWRLIGLFLNQFRQRTGASWRISGGGGVTGNFSAAFSRKLAS
jgi:hypothetical protein